MGAESEGREGEGVRATTVSEAQAGACGGKSRLLVRGRVRRVCHCGQQTEPSTAMGSPSGARITAFGFL